MRRTRRGSSDPFTGMRSCGRCKELPRFEVHKFAPGSRVNCPTASHLHPDVVPCIPSSESQLAEQSSEAPQRPDVDIWATEYGNFIAEAMGRHPENGVSAKYPLL